MRWGRVKGEGVALGLRTLDAPLGDYPIAGLGGISRPNLPPGEGGGLGAWPPRCLVNRWPASQTTVQCLAAGSASADITPC